MSCLYINLFHVSDLVYTHWNGLLSWQKLMSSILIRFKLLWIVSQDLSTSGLQFWIDSCIDESYHSWFDSNYFDLYHCFSLTLVFGIVIRFTRLVNRINLHLGQFESIHYRSESYQSSCFILLVFLLSESNHTLSESIQYVFFYQNIALNTIFYIYSYPPNTQTTKSFAFILSRVSKPYCSFVLEIKHLF